VDASDQLYQHRKTDMEQTSEEIQAVKQRLRLEYGTLFDAIAAILFRHDPIDINYENNTDEYEPEARTILPRLRTCQSAEDVQSVVYEEFQQWFGDEMVDSAEGYKAISEEIWCLWQNSGASHFCKYILQPIEE
jgi:hypothetical protein